MSRYLQIEGNVVAIDIDRIEPSPFQARKVFSQESIDELAQSIAQNGLLQPVSVRRIGHNRFQLIAGERRLRACKQAGVKKISAIICEMSDNVSAVFGYIENSQRADLNPFEQAKGIKSLLEIWQVTQEEAAARLGMTQSTLCNKLRLLSLTEQEQQLCLKYNLTERHARAVLTVCDVNRRAELLKRAGEKQLNVTELEALIKQTAEKKPQKKRRIMIQDVRIFANTINRAISFMKSAGVNATSVRQDTDEYIEYVVRIPLKQAVNG